MPPKNQVFLWFDCYQTLIYKKELVPTIQLFAQRTMRVNLSRRAVAVALETLYQRRKFEHPRFNSLASRVAYYKDYNRELFRLLGWELTPRAAQRLNAVLRRSPYICYKDVVPVLRALRKIPAVRLGILANWTETLPDILTQLELIDYFDIICTSEQLGVAKPNPKIFSKALNRAGVKSLRPTSCYYIGDDYELDIAPARAAGWQTILIDRFGRYPARACVPKITTLFNLPLQLKFFQRHYAI